MDAENITLAEIADYLVDPEGCGVKVAVITPRLHETYACLARDLIDKVPKGVKWEGCVARGISLSNGSRVWLTRNPKVLMGMNLHLAVFDRALVTDASVMTARTRMRYEKSVGVRYLA